MPLRKAGEQVSRAAAQHAMEPTAREVLSAAAHCNDVRPTNERRTRMERRRMRSMGIKELEAAALKLEPKARARLASRLLDSLEDLSPEENARVWAEEAQRRADALDAGSLTARSAEDVFRDAQARL